MESCFFFGRNMVSQQATGSAVDDCTETLELHLLRDEDFESTMA